MSWEYKVIDLNIKAKSFFSAKNDNALIEQQLNDLGRQGWELVSSNIGSSWVHKAANSSFAILKRPR